MISAAGILFIAPDGKVLLMRRTGKDYPGTWALPGGGVEDNESVEECARRETLEETGQNYEGDLIPWTRRVKDDIDFCTFLARSEEFKPELNDEHDGYQWVERLFAISSPLLHPGVNIALLRFDLDELSTAKAMMSGELVSPQRYANVLLVLLRVTGTGAAFRHALNEYVWRDSGLYLTPEFLERCNGLPIVIEHPERNMLDSKEFRDRIAGTVFVPFIRDDEVWCVAKIYDMEIAQLIEEERMSTSPAVVFLNAEKGSKYSMSNGKTLLIEGKPSLLDHLALLMPGDAGVWDKNGPLAGVESVDAVEAVADSASALDVILRELKVNEVCRLTNRL